MVSSRHISRVKIVDYRTKRAPLNVQTAGEGLRIINPPGYLALNSITLLKALKTTLFMVNGEEDLLVLAVAREGDFKVAYGQPNVGVVVLSKDRTYVLNLIKAFKPEVIVYHNNQRD